MIWILSIVSTLHLIAVLFAAAAPCYALWLEWNASRRGDAVADALGRQMARWAMVWLTFGMALGAVALGLLWLQGTTPYFSALGIIPARRLWFGVAELVVYLLGMAAYLRWWRTMPRPLHRFLAIFNAANLLYHFPPLFTAIAVASTRPELWNNHLGYRQTLSLFGDTETLARTLHVILAGFAIAGVVLMWLARRAMAADITPAPGTPEGAAPAAGQGTAPEASAAADEPAARWLRRGAGAALLFAVLQLPAGVLMLMVLPPASRDRLLMGDWLSTGMLAAAVFFALGLMHTLAAVALGDRSRTAVRNAAICLALVMFLMVAVRHRTRELLFQNFQSRGLTTELRPATIQPTGGGRGTNSPVHTRT